MPGTGRHARRRLSLPTPRRKQLAANIVARLKGLPTQPFRYRPRGQLSSVGHNKAVAEVMGLKVSGFIAWLMWRGLYLLRIPTLARKSRLFLEWNWAMFFPPDISHFGYRRSQRRNSPIAEPKESPVHEIQDSRAKSIGANTGHLKGNLS